MNVLLHYKPYSDGTLVKFRSIISNGVIGDQYIECENPFEGNHYWAKLINGNYTLHRYNGPAVLRPSKDKLHIKASYYLDGVYCHIADLHCDNETKMILALKYGDSE